MRYQKRKGIGRLTHLSLLWCCVLSACSVKVLYQGPELPDDKTSYVQVTEARANLSHSIIKVDGKSVGFTYRYLGYRLLPGVYEISVKYTAEWENCEIASVGCPELFSDGVCKVVLRLSEGTSYTIELDARHRTGLFKSPIIPAHREVFFRAFATGRDTPTRKIAEDSCEEFGTYHYRPFLS